MATPPYVAEDLIPPYCAIRIWRGKETEGFVDVTKLQKEGGLAVLNKAENRGGSATFTLSNDTDVPSLNMCSPFYNAWSDGVEEAIRPGMYVEFFDVSEDTEPRLIMDGRITTMTPSVDTIAFEVGDGITFLGKAGTWLRRNYRDTGGSVTRLLPIDLTTEPPSIDLSKQEGTPSFPVIRYKSYERELSTSGNTVTIPRVQDGLTYTRLRYVNVEFTYNFRQTSSFSANGHFKAMVGENVAYSEERRFNYASQTGRITLAVDMDFMSMVKPSDQFAFSVVFEKTSGAASTVRDLTINVQGLKAISDTEESISTSTSRIDFPNLSDLDRTYPDRRLSVLFEQGRQLTSDIMGQIADAIGLGSEISVDTPNVVLPIYRVGGSYAQTYLQKLADLADENGRRLSYTVDGISSVLKVGRRHSVDDAVDLTVSYAGANGGIPISDFRPRRTLKNRPNLVTLKANISGETSQTVVVSFEDVFSTEERGCTIESLVADSSANSLKTVGQAAFNALEGTTLDQWEGELILPGIIYGVMGEGSSKYAGSGIVIGLSDIRFGIVYDKVKVCQVAYDYNACVTKLTINNYDMQYSSNISNTNALAVEVSDMVGGISDTTLYNQQYVYVKALDEEWNAPQNVTVQIRSSKSNISKTVETQCVYVLPNNTAVIIASFDTEDGIYLPNDDPFGIDTIMLGGRSTPISIPENRRPDLLAGQTLMVCIIVRTP